jgi:hypothetical protein
VSETEKNLHIFIIQYGKTEKWLTSDILWASFFMSHLFDDKFLKHKNWAIPVNMWLQFKKKKNTYGQNEIVS